MSTRQAAKGYSARWYQENKEYVKKRNAAYRRENKERIKALRAKWFKKNKNYNREDRARRVFNLSLEQYDEFMKAEKCNICELVFPEGYKKNLDHCHTTNLIRGVLCHSCNVGLGHFKDDPNLLMAAISYLRKGFKP